MKYVTHLSKDKKLAKIINVPFPQLKNKKDTPHLLIASIISQQLSTKVAAIIHQRFLSIYKNKNPKMQVVVNTDYEALRKIGLSNAKVGYVQNVAKFFIEQKITDKQLQKMSNDEIVELLTQIKGVGKWTCEMLLMFALGREDVFAVDDLGIQTAMIKMYKLESLDKKELKQKMIFISEKWSPYKTYACMHLWQWKDA